MPSADDLILKHCLPCEGIGKVLEPIQISEYLKTVPQWKLLPNGKAIYREYLMKNFMAAIRFINEVAKLAEEENHHPDIQLTGYRKLKIELSTHALGGLTENDFIEAAKIDRIPAEIKI